MADGHPMVMAGLWDAWKNPATSDTLHSITIIITEANAALAPGMTACR